MVSGCPRSPASRPTAIPIVGLAAAVAVTASAGLARAEGPCLRFGAPRMTGALANGGVLESSGLAVSVHQAGVWFTHNDSGDGPRLFAFDGTGSDLATFEVTGAQNVDWEDLALGPCGEAPACLFIGDVGDNGRARDTVSVYRVAEPLVAGPGATARALQLELTYSDGARDVEALLVDPRTGDLFLVEKTDALAARVSVLRGASRLGAGAYVLDALGAVEVLGFVTGGDFDPTGREIVLRTYGGAAGRWVARRDAEGVVQSLDRLDAPSVDILGEAITYRSDGMALLTTREGAGAPLFETPCLDPNGEAPGDPVGPLVVAATPPSDAGCGGDAQSALWVLGLAGLRWRTRGRRPRLGGSTEPACEAGPC